MLLIHSRRRSFIKSKSPIKAMNDIGHIKILNRRMTAKGVGVEEYGVTLLKPNGEKVFILLSPSAFFEASKKASMLKGTLTSEPL